MTPPLLEVQGLSVEFQTRRGSVTAVDDVSFSVSSGQVLGIVGESGSGKSATALAILRLHDPAVARLRGSVRFQGKDLLGVPERELQLVRGAKIAMVFQEPTVCLNPSLTVGRQVEEAIALHERLPAGQLRERAVKLLEEVGIPEPAERLSSHPHQLSGGMCQRVMISMALACRPQLLLADEPTTALDVTIQAQILELLLRLQRERHMSVVLISHDLGLVAEACDEILVMYAGQVVEGGPADEVLGAPAHPYTAALLASVPGGRMERGRLAEIPGVVPNLLEVGSGCRFHDRCSVADPRCREQAPALTARGPRSHRCFRPLQADGGAP